MKYIIWILYAFENGSEFCSTKTRGKSKFLRLENHLTNDNHWEQFIKLIELKSVSRIFLERKPRKFSKLFPSNSSCLDTIKL